MYPHFYHSSIDYFSISVNFFCKWPLIFWSALKNSSQDGPRFKRWDFIGPGFSQISMYLGLRGGPYIFDYLSQQSVLKRSKNCIFDTIRDGQDWRTTDCHSKYNRLCRFEKAFWRGRPLNIFTRLSGHTGPAHTTEPPRHKPLLVNRVVVGPFEQEGEGTSVTSDVGKVQGKGPATPGPLT